MMYLILKAARSNCFASIPSADATTRHCGAFFRCCTRVVSLAAGAINMNQGDLIIDGNTTFTNNTSSMTGGETHQEPERR